MSFLPVSEALLRLEIEGLLESRPRAGTRVRIPSPEDVQGHYVVREALEVQAAMRFARVSTPGERAELAKLAVRVDQLSTQIGSPAVSDRSPEDARPDCSGRAMPGAARCDREDPRPGLDLVLRDAAAAHRRPPDPAPGTGRRRLQRRSRPGRGRSAHASGHQHGARHGGAAAVPQAAEGHRQDVPSQRQESPGTARSPLPN